MTANQAYKQYKSEGGTLTFADYITREKAKNFVNFNGEQKVPTNAPLADSIKTTLSQMRHDSGLKTGVENKYIFGIHRNVWIVAGAVSVAAGAYIVYKRFKK